MLRFKAIVLLALFSFSAFGNTFEIHYCEGQITDIALFGSANCVCDNEVAVETKACHTEHDSCCESQVPSEDQNSIEKKTCCESEFTQVIKTVEFQKTANTIQFAWIANVVFNPTFFIAQNSDINSEFIYIDPESWTDIPIKLQRFLI
ncbi:MAG: hypothetical protein GQ574_09505 [Crocinitomix sp.]|nr:hypothetical protein [Crocinitomix sp.]